MDYGFVVSLWCLMVRPGAFLKMQIRGFGFISIFDGVIFEEISFWVGVASAGECLGK